MVRKTTQNALSHSEKGIIKSFFLFFFLFGASCHLFGNGNISSTVFLCPDLNSPAVQVFNVNAETISEACGGDLITVEIVLADSDEEITSFSFFQDLNANSEYDPGEELVVTDFELDGMQGAFQLTSDNPGPVFFSIIVSGCSEYSQIVNDFEFVSCGIGAEQLCFCLDNATIDEDGEFLDTYIYSSYTGDELTVVGNTGAINADDQNLYAEGFVFASDVDGNIEFSVVHTDRLGYELLLENRNGQIFSIAGMCAYPDPEINLVNSYCTNHEDIIIAVIAEGLAGTAEVFLDGNPITVFSPSALGEGVYTVDYSFTADPSAIPSASGCTSYRSFEIEVFGDSPPSLVCNSFLNLSLSSAGFYVLTPDVIISDNGSIGCYSSFDLEIFGQDHDTIFCSQAGDQIFAMVTDPATNSSCFSTITVFDKTGPAITGPDTIAVNCSLDENDPSLLEFVQVTDNCSSEIELTYENYQFNFFFCYVDDPSLVKQYVRRYRATDEHGNVSFFEQLIQFIRPAISEIEFPRDTLLSCDTDAELLTAEHLGEPSFGGIPVSLMNCIYQVTYTDEPLPGGCSGVEGIRRTWNVLDPCTIGSISFDQDIIFADTTDPVIICPDTMQLAVAAGNCFYNFVLHEPLVTDNCSENILVFTLYQNRIVFSDHIDLPVGEHRFTIYANDMCGNLDSCSYIVNVFDEGSPVIACEIITVALDESGESTINISGLDFLVSDNCGIADTLVRRSNHPDFGTELYFTCNDVTEPVEIIIRVTDINGNMTETQCLVIVEDNIAPAIDCGVPFNPIDCSEIPFNLNDLFPIPDFSDNCIIGSTDNDIIANLDDCLEGTIVRTFTATDISGNSTSCEQTIIVENNSALAEADIAWPEDIRLETCVPVTDIAITGSPVFDDSVFCTEIEVNFVDTESSDDSNNCIVIERQWEIIDVCAFSKSGGVSGIFTFLQTITTRPADYDLIVPEDITVSADADCEAFIELSPAFAFNCIQDITITNDYDAGQGGQISGNFELGVTEITFFSTDGCGNIKSASVSITVEDHTAPHIEFCPGDIVIDCNDDISDLTVYGEIIANDNCGVADITEEVIFDLETCGSGEIRREWTVTDIAGNSSTCEQIITIEGPAPLSFSAITWPQDIELQGCDPDYDPAVSGEPVLPAGECRIVEITYIDTEADDAEGCLFLERTWTVIDNCDLYLPGENIFTYTQNIYDIDVRDFELIIDPVLIAETDSDFCEAYFDIVLAIQGQCESAVDVSWEVTYPDNSVQAGSGLDVSAFYPAGITTILFSADTECFGTKTAEVEVIVEDNDAPVITVVPGDITISCTNMSFDITDGFEAYDPCGIETSFTYIDTLLIDDCGIGIYRVNFTAIDVNGNSSIASRLVEFFGDMEGISEDDFNTLQDTVDIACGNPVNTGELLYTGLNSCIPVEISFADEVDNSQPGYCAVITRTWTAFSACNPENNTVEVVQVIRIVEDDDAPDLNAIQDTTVYIGENSCEAVVIFDEQAVDECLVRTISNDSPFAYSNEGLPDGSYPPGTYVVEIIAEDYCGNISFKSIIISVIDDVPPAVECLAGLEFSLEPDGEIEINVGELAFLSSACDGDYLTFSSEGEAADTSILFDCTGLGSQEITIYAFDQEGNSGYCVQTITIIDLGLSCGGVGGIISGAVNTVYGEPIGHVNVEVKSAELILSKESSDGEYSFNVLFDRDYIIGADKPDDMNNGVTILDLIILAQNIVENRQFETPYHYLAADVNNDRKINFMDLVEMRSVMMRRQEQFSGGKAWRFVPGGWIFPEGGDVLKSDVPEQIIVKDLKEDLREQNFIGIKIGDLNNSAVALRSATEWTYELTESNMNGTARLRIYPDNIHEWLGMDLNFSLPAGAKVLNSRFIGTKDASQLTLDDSFLSSSVYKLIVFSVLPVNRGATPSCLEVEFLNLPDDFDFDLLFEKGSEAVSGNLDLFDIRFLRKKGEESEEHRVYPNPFKHTSTIEIVAGAVAENVRFTITDQTGRDIYTGKINLSEGENRIWINSNMISVPGVYFYRIQTDSATLQGRLIKID